MFTEMQRILIFDVYVMKIVYKCIQVGKSSSMISRPYHTHHNHISDYLCSKNKSRNIGTVATSPKCRLFSFWTTRSPSTFSTTKFYQTTSQTKRSLTKPTLFQQWTRKVNRPALCMCMTAGCSRVSTLPRKKISLYPHLCLCSKKMLK